MNIMTIESFRVNTLSSILMYYYKLTLFSPPTRNVSDFRRKQLVAALRDAGEPTSTWVVKKDRGEGGEILGVEQGQ